jgi:hypothetical protein
MFHFPSFPPHALYIQARVTALTYGRVSPFGHPRITARLTAPRGLSRPTTSFIGSWCQGIHRAPLKTWPQRCSHPLFRSQTPTGSPPSILIRTRQPYRSKARYTIARRSGSEEDNSRSLRDREPARCFLRTQQCVTVCDVPPMSAGVQTCAGTNRTALRKPDQRHDGRPT